MLIYQDLNPHVTTVNEQYVASVWLRSDPDNPVNAKQAAFNIHLLNAADAGTLQSGMDTNPTIGADMWTHATAVLSSLVDASAVRVEIAVIGSRGCIVVDDATLYNP
jgi:hypothetical protein